MQTDADKDRTQALARDAFAWMVERNIPPTPENFELSYNFVAGEHAELKRAIGALIANGCKFDASVMMILHQRYFRFQIDARHCIGVVVDEFGRIDGKKAEARRGCGAHRARVGSPAAGGHRTSRRRAARPRTKT